MRLSLAAEMLQFEFRGDRPAYDEQSPSTIRHPNGSVLACGDRALCGALTKHVLDVWTAS